MKTRFIGRVLLAYFVICLPAIPHGQALSNQEVYRRATQHHAVEVTIWRIPARLFSPATPTRAMTTAFVLTGSGHWGAPTSPTPAEQSVLMLRVTDIHKKPVPALQLKVGNGPVSAPTDVGEIARTPLPQGTKPGDLVKLHLVTPAKGLLFISPWDQEVIVPSLESSEVISVVIANQGDRALLVNTTALTSMTENVLKRIQPRKNSEPVSGWQRESLARVSTIYGFQPKDLDQAIRAWGQTTENSAPRKPGDK
jgi:hypothetical protein